MQNLLTLTIIVEPDRQRLARFAMDAVEALGGNVFASANTLEGLLRRLREDGVKTKLPVEVNLELEEQSLYLTWGERHEVLATLAQPPSADTAFSRQ